MTTNTIIVPVWVVSILLPTIVTLIIGFGQYKYTSGIIENRIQNIELRVANTEKNKVDNKTFELLQKQLDRIEKNLDIYIHENTKK